MEELLLQIQKMIRELKTSSDHMLFQNHLYGCLYLCELIEKKEITNLEPFQNIYIFNDVGKNYGYEETTFISDEVYKTLWNQMFNSILTEESHTILSLEQQVVEILDKYEEHTYFLDNLSNEDGDEVNIEKEGELKNQETNENNTNNKPKNEEINNIETEEENEEGDSKEENDEEETNKETTEEPENETTKSHVQSISIINKKRKTIHKSHRSITPIKHRKGAGKTRKNKRHIT